MKNDTLTPRRKNAKIYARSARITWQQKVQFLLWGYRGWRDDWTANRADIEYQRFVAGGAEISGHIEPVRECGAGEIPY